MENNCLFCKKVFSTKGNYKKHLQKDNCNMLTPRLEISNILELKENNILFKNKEIISKDLIIDIKEKELISKKEIIIEKDKEILTLKEQLKKAQTIINSPHHINHSTVNSPNSHNNYNINITINPIDKLNVDYIKKEELQGMFDKLNKDQAGHMDLVLKNYIRSILSNEDHPENHAVKYTKKDPPMFSTIVTENDKQKCVINDLKDTCDLISQPLIEVMLKKIKKSWGEMKQDPDFDDMDQNLVDALRDTLKNERVREILKRYLKSDILENVEMKIQKIK
jgi:hypothetical protein